jgi:hypothetical protein
MPQHITSIRPILETETEDGQVVDHDGNLCTTPTGPILTLSSTNDTILTIPPTTCRPPHTSTPTCHDIATHKAQPRLTDSTIGNTYAHHNHLPTHCPNPTIRTFLLAIDTSEHKHYTNHIHTSQHSTLKPPLYHQTHSTHTTANTQPQTYPIQPYKQHTQIPPT